MSIHASNNPFPCGSPAGPGTDFPPIANTYVNPTALFADQANQVEGYLYSITDATGFDNITQGRATVSYKGTTNGDESDYDIEWRDNNGLITKRTNQGVVSYYRPDSDTNASRGEKLLEVLNSVSSGDYITVYQGTYETYIPIQPNLDNVTIDFKNGAIVTDDGTRDLISNDGDYDITLNIVGKGTFINTSNVGNQNRAINIDDGTILNIEGKSIISETAVCIRTAKNSGGGSTITANFEYYQSADGTFDNVDPTSVMNLYGNYALSTGNFVLEDDGGIINCFIKRIESQGTNPIERASNGIINLYGTHIIAPSGEILAFNSSAAENLNFYNCTGVCDVANPIQDNYTGTIFINSDFYTDSNATLEEKTDKTPVVKKDLTDELTYLNDNLQALINGKVSKAGDTMTGNLIVDSNIGIGTATPTEKLEVNGNISNTVGSGGNITLYETDANRRNRLFLGADENGGYIRGVFNTRGKRNIIINENGGNVGIGVNNPIEKLEVNGKIKATDINFTGLPTSATGLSTGDVWNDGGTLKIVT